MDDLISRQAVLDAMYELCNTGETLKENPWRDNPHIDAITDVINNLPSVNPQEPTDTWSIKDVADTFKKHGLIVEQEPCEDAISRAEAIRVASGYCHWTNIPAELAKLPPVNQKPCGMTAEEYRKRMIQAFHNADCDELISVCVLPTEKEFENLEWLLKNHYKKEPCEDAISRKQALDAFGLSDKTRKYGGDHSGYNTMMRYEIQDVIEGLPSVNPQASNEDIHREREQAYMKGYEDASKKYRTEPCEDAISRQMVKEQMIKYGFHAPDITVTEFVEDLPPATPQQKTGRWRHYEGMLICSKCGAEFYDDIMEYCGDDVPKCCPDCGAKMEVEE